MCIPPFCPSGRLGWASTGASTAFSNIIDSAKLPVKHMPIAPTPLPPHSLCACAASARSHWVIGLEALAAKARNSLEMQALAIVLTAYQLFSVAPSLPNRCGI